MEPLIPQNYAQNFVLNTFAAITSSFTHFFSISFNKKKGNNQIDHTHSSESFIMSLIYTKCTIGKKKDQLILSICKKVLIYWWWSSDC